MLLTAKIGFDVMVGLFWGLLAGYASYRFLQRTIRKNAAQTHQKATMALVNAQFVRYFVDMAALAVVCKHVWVLLGTAIGLTVMLKYTIVEQFMDGKKHPSVARRHGRARTDALREPEYAGDDRLVERSGETAESCDIEGNKSWYESLIRNRYRTDHWGGRQK
jgi:hypothetical protein